MNVIDLPVYLMPPARLLGGFRSCFSKTCALNKQESGPTERRCSRCLCTHLPHRSESPGNAVFMTLEQADDRESLVKNSWEAPGRSRAMFCRSRRPSHFTWNMSRTDHDGPSSFKPVATLPRLRRGIASFQHETTFCLASGF